MMELKLVVLLTIVVCVSMGASSPSDIDRVEKNLLSMLGMKRRPVIDQNEIQIPRAMIDLYEDQINYEYDSTSLPLPGRIARSANTVRSYTHQASPIDERFHGGHRFRLNFNLTDFPANEIVTSTELRLTIVPTENRTGSQDFSHSEEQRVNVYDIVEPGIKGVKRAVLRLVDTKLLQSCTTQNLLLLDVLPIVHRWLSNAPSDDNHGILIDIRSSTDRKVESTPVRLKRADNENDQMWQAIQPLLFLYIEDTNVQKVPVNFADPKRRKRSPAVSTSAPYKGRRKTRNECHRHQLWVDFDRVGWNDWIVAPPGYDAYFCAGNCPSQFGDHLNATNHAVVQTLVNSVFPTAIPKPCCVPTSLTSMSLLYLDENNKAVLKNYPDMVVQGCGCR